MKKIVKYFDNHDSFETYFDIFNWLNDQSICKVLENNKRIKITVEKAESKRSIKANNFYWGVIILAFQREWPDFSKDDVHYVLSERFRKIRKDQHVINREIMEDIHETEWKIKSTTKDNQFEFWLYCEQCLQALYEIGGHLEKHEAIEYEETKKNFNR